MRKYIIPFDSVTYLGYCPAVSKSLKNFNDFSLEMRSVLFQGIENMITSKLTGDFMDDEKTRTEFYKFIDMASSK